MGRAANLQLIAAMPKDALRNLSEREFQRALMSYAEDHGWKIHYMYKSAQRLADGSYRGLGTAGWPDLFGVHITTGRAVAIECKSERGRASDAQQEWLGLLATVEGCDAFLWRPRDAAVALTYLREVTG